MHRLLLLCAVPAALGRCDLPQYSMRAASEAHPGGDRGKTDQERLREATPCDLQSYARYPASFGGCRGFLSDLGHNDIHLPVASNLFLHAAHAYLDAAVGCCFPVPVFREFFPFYQ